MLFHLQSHSSSLYCVTRTENPFTFRASFTRGGLNVLKNIQIFITLYTVMELGGEELVAKLC